MQIDYVKVKFSHTRYRVLGPELIPVYRQSAVGCHYFPPGLQLPSKLKSQYQIILLGDKRHMGVNNCPSISLDSDHCPMPNPLDYRVTQLTSS